MATLQTDLSRDGFLFLRRLASSDFRPAVLESLGVLAPIGSGVHTLQPQRTDQTTPNTYSGLYGLSAFPLHTDFAHWAHPPRYLAIRCLKGYPDVATQLVDGTNIVRELGVDLLGRALVRSRRPNPKSAPFLRLYEEIGDHRLVRWDQVFLKPASAVGSVAMDSLRAALAIARPVEIALAAPGDTLIIDNWRMLHGRGAVGEHQTDRLLQRAYLETVN